MPATIYGMSEADLFRVIAALTAIRDPAIRAEFLRTIEAWVEDQWHMDDPKR